MVKVRKFPNLMFKTFGRLTVIRYSGVFKGHSTWLCRCSCGAYKVVRGDTLLKGTTVSCGCYNLELRRSVPLRHGMYKSKTYRAWLAMKNRCYYVGNVQFMDYGGRGIKVCDRWKDSFENFYADMGDCPEGLTLDRIDVNGNYEPGNCRWVTQKDQCRNMRSNRILKVGKREGCITEIAEHFGICRGTLYNWLNRNGNEKFFSYLAKKCSHTFESQLFTWETCGLS